MENNTLVTIGLFVLNGVLGVIVYLLKLTLSDIKDKLNQNEQAISHVKEHYFKKEDFREFKEELWKRFDKLESKVDERGNK